jgi:hypothetical protein
MGVFSKECRSFVKELARRIRLQNNDSTAYLFLCQRSVIIQRYNSVCIYLCCQWEAMGDNGSFLQRVQIVCKRIGQKNPIAEQ